MMKLFTANSTANCAVLASALLTFVATTGPVLAGKVHVVVDTSSVVNTMRGGIGASWHAIEKPISTTYDPVFEMDEHGGSGWGGNPPAEDEEAWEQICRHASWLGMDFVRVELEQRMYEPERKAFDWDNPEMRILCRILDWCQRNEADVFLTQMWANVRWNAFPEFRDVPARTCHSGPLSMDDFAQGLATCVEYLVKNKKYSCIKWLCITNEPGNRWSWWVRPPREPMPLRPGLVAVRKALDKRGVDVVLSGPDSVGIPPLDPKRFDFQDVVGAYDLHTYSAKYDWFDRPGFVRVADLQKNMGDWASWAHKQDKAFFITELGINLFGRGGSFDGPVSYESELLKSQIVIRGLGVGVDAFNRWSFNNRGDLDGQKQMIETWDRDHKRLRKQITPCANPYFVYGLLSRFTAKHSGVLACSVTGGLHEDYQRVFAVALRGPDGSFTIAVVNEASVGWDLEVDMQPLDAPTTLYRYGVTEKDRDRDDLKISPLAEYALSKTETQFHDSLAPRSLTILTTYRLPHKAPGIIAGDTNNLRRTSNRQKYKMIVMGTCHGK